MKQYSETIRLINYFPTGLTTWRSLVEGYKHLKYRLAWEVYNGKTLRFWLDDWLDEGRLLELCLNLVPLEALHDSVYHCFTACIEEYISPMIHCFPPYVLEKQSLAVSSARMKPDQPRWTLDSKGVSTSKTLRPPNTHSFPAERLAWKNLRNYTLLCFLRRNTGVRPPCITGLSSSDSTLAAFTSTSEVAEVFSGTRMPLIGLIGIQSNSGILKFQVSVGLSCSVTYWIWKCSNEIVFSNENEPLPFSVKLDFIRKVSARALVDHPCII